MNSTNEAYNFVNGSCHTFAFIYLFIAVFIFVASASDIENNLSYDHLCLLSQQKAKPENMLSLELAFFPLRAQHEKGEKPACKSYSMSRF